MIDEATGSVRPGQPPAIASPPLVAISLLNWNNWQDTLECLESVRRLDYANYLTVVVDNGSWDNSVERIRGWAKRTGRLPSSVEEGGGGGEHERNHPSPSLMKEGSLAFVEYTREQALRGGDPNSEAGLDAAQSLNRLVLIRNEENQGWTGGNNAAIHYALTRHNPAKYIFLLNNDAEVDSECVSTLVSVSQKADAGIVGGIPVEREDHGPRFEAALSFVRFLFGPLISPAIPYRGKDEFWKSGVVSGAAMLVRRDVLQTFYDANGEYLFTRLFMYWDDQAFCRAADKLQYLIVYARKAIVYHHQAGKSFGGILSPHLFYYRERNKILAANMGLSLGWRILFHILNPPLALARVIKYLRLQPRLARAAFYGLLDGYRGIGGKWRDHDREMLAKAALPAPDVKMVQPPDSSKVEQTGSGHMPSGEG